MLATCASITHHLKHSMFPCIRLSAARGLAIMRQRCHSPTIRRQGIILVAADALAHGAL